MRFVLATGNAHKISEMRAILSGLGIDTLPQSELGLALDPDETGATFEENALIKARAVCAASGMPSIADDSGLVVDALDGAPGVFSKRFGGAGLDDAGKNSLLLQMLENIDDRAAKFVCVIACAFPDGEALTARGECRGEILREKPRGGGGFGYDPVFLVSGTDKSMAELSEREKNAVSHRGNALRAFAEMLKSHLNL